MLWILRTRLYLLYMSKNTDKWINKRFGKLKVVSCDNTIPPHYYMWFNCECECGKKVKILKDVILRKERNKKTNSCGCSHLTTGKSNLGNRYPTKALKHIGEKHNRLTIINTIPNPNIKGYLMVCQCDCGEVVESIYADIKKGKVKSCGCYQREQASKWGSINGPNNCTKNCNKHNWHIIQNGTKIKLRSGYEVMYALYLNKKNIQWEYEPKCFILKNGMRYTPDFYFPQQNKWIEIKGQLKKSHIIKMKEFRNQGNKLTLIQIKKLQRVFGMSYSGFRKRWDNGYYSSKTCYDCGYIHQSLKENDREWDCPICNVNHDRDYNASLNILKQGLSGLGTKSDSKQKRSKALMTISGKPEKIVKSTTCETKKLIKRGNPLALAGG